MSREAFLNELACRILALSGQSVLRIAIDGVDGAGKTTLANELAQQLRQLAPARPLIRATVDGFHQPRALRYRQGKDSAQGFFEDSYNYQALKAVLLEPLSPGGSGRYRRAVFNHQLDAETSDRWEQAQPGSILLFDGIFLHRPELRSYWEASVFLELDFAQSIARCAVRDGTPPDPDAPAHQRYLGGQKIYLQSCQPQEYATWRIDYRDLKHPRFIQCS